MNLTEEEVELLNSKEGLRRLFANKKVNLERALRLANYDVTLKELQTELIKLQTWVIENNKKVVVIFEGRDAAGKGGAIRRITAYINPRRYRVVALNKPTEEEKGQWYFQRYVNHLPRPGEIVFFDRSWYNRAIVEPVNGFCTMEEHERFMGQVNEFEKMIQSADTYLVKLYFSISKEEQAERFEEIKSDPLKRWKITPVDLRAQELWDEYTKYKEKMFAHTNTENAPWVIIKANKKTEARISALSHILETIPYE
ncbi:polyphosphate kinase 2 [Jiulongibacter sediminis]|uniref:ADP/GDP-polyphosphate phosphotransferase n=1 Tax=Jiulongibacter sediminis TaxID=1605367 RepID=A0A0P7BUG9_9BACT|nr:polyphosphate kinase 2 [Jiulongibacter sediminis]KPM48419.1 polyphosphate kinase [Jiulongibacter sediminis]TBX24960.1 polyphosphate kinase [Jiulongibacter sediminis]